MYLSLTLCQTGCEVAGEYFGAPLYEYVGVSAVEEERVEHGTWSPWLPVDWPRKITNTRESKRIGT